jgi:aminoglycoside phosphotransferase (APT) family kinase protein
MARPWDPDVEVTPELARRLVDEQFPVLAPARVEPLAVGWDNAAFLVDDAWVLRLPRRRLGALCMEAELRWLPALAPQMTVPVSASTFVGHPTSDYPYPFGAYRRIEGETGCRATAGVACARDVGRFLRRLHEVPAPAEAPADTLRRAEMTRGLLRVTEPSRRLASRGIDLVPILRRMEALAHAPAWSGPPRWVHGDLYARHVIVDPAGRLAGVIDWGDVHAGDPALDLSIAFSLFSGEARATLLDACGGTDSDTLDRARFRALSYGIYLLDYGLESGDEALAVAGTRALERAGGTS